MQLTDEQKRLFGTLLNDFQRVLANGKLAYQDLQGDGYEAMEYLKNIRAWAQGGETDLLILLRTFDPELHLQFARWPDTDEWDNEDNDDEE